MTTNDRFEVNCSKMKISGSLCNVNYFHQRLVALNQFSAIFFRNDRNCSFVEVILYRN